MAFLLFARILIVTQLLALLMVSSSVYADAVSKTELNERLIKLEEDNKQLTQKLKKVTAKNNKKIRSIKRTLSTHSDRIRFNGFLSAMATKNNKNIDLSFEGVGLDNRWSFSPDSIIGLQWDYQVVENTTATVQIVSKGAKGFQTEAEWAYISLHLTDSFMFRAGRLRSPDYFKSETFEVGFSYPWVRPPIDVYIADVTSYEGISLDYASRFQDWFIDYQLIAGSIDEELTKIREQFGFIVTANHYDWTYRFAYSLSNKLITRAIESIAPADKIEYFVFAMAYDNGTWEIILEGAELLPSKDALVNGNTTGFLSIARTAGNWTPYIVFGAADSDAKEDHRIDDLETMFNLAGLGTTYHQKSTVLGLRYTLNPKTALKIEAGYYFDFEQDGVSRFKLLDLSTKPLPTFMPDKVEELGNSATLLTLGFDIIF